MNSTVQISTDICMCYIYYIYLHINIYLKTMATTAAVKRKIIDLPAETFQKLSLMAVAQGKSLKAYIESELIAKANNISVEVKENPSPSNDEWFNNPENISELDKGIRELKEGRTKAYSMTEIKNILGV